MTPVRRWSLLLCALLPAAATAADLYRADGWPALATDRVARDAGDILTVVIYENATATNGVSNSSKRGTRIGGGINAGRGFDHRGEIALDSSFQGDGQTARNGRMVAQISVNVDAVLPNGDLQVSGAQALRINNERTNIRLRGLVRPADIGADNSVLSSRIAHAEIDYEGSGFVTRGARPGIVTRIFAWLGLS